MTVINVEKDAAKATMIVTSEFDAPVDHVWQLWADPRLLERWWGPPTYPATVTEHNLTPGGKVKYFMTGPARRDPGSRLVALWQSGVVNRRRIARRRRVQADAHRTTPLGVMTDGRAALQHLHATVPG